MNLVIIIKKIISWSTAGIHFTNKDLTRIPHGYFKKIKMEFEMKILVTIFENEILYTSVRKIVKYRKEETNETFL